MAEWKLRFISCTGCFTTCQCLQSKFWMSLQFVFERWLMALCWLMPLANHVTHYLVVGVLSSVRILVCLVSLQVFLLVSSSCQQLANDVPVLFMICVQQQSIYKVGLFYSVMAWLSFTTFYVHSHLLKWLRTFRISCEGQLLLSESVVLKVLNSLSLCTFVAAFAIKACANFLMFWVYVPIEFPLSTISQGLKFLVCSVPC